MKILAFAYACEPDKGSEPWAGWMWARILARLGHATIITRANNRPSIERGLTSVPESRQLRFVYVDLPDWTMFWKKGHRGARLYYVLWQLRALREARRLHKQAPFDLVWHLTLANIWIGSVAGRLGVPFVYGPVGGGVRFPWRLVRAAGVRGAVYELGRAMARLTGRYLNPLARSAWRRAGVVFVQNPETKDWLPRAYRGKAVILPNAVLERPSEATSSQRELRTAMFAGRLQPLKGVALAIEAVARTEDWVLWICGDGRDGKRLRKLANRLGVADRVSFFGHLPRPKVLAMMRRADAFIFPSLHEEAGLVVLEALDAGVRPIFLKRGGPPVLAGQFARQVDVGTYGEVVGALTSSLLSSAGPLHDIRDHLLNFSPSGMSRRAREGLNALPDLRPAKEIPGDWR